ncbi:MAG: hypothetical protein KF708_13510 [Pirellulales bacterium]|nr:hypothetical protein [Pirellulales bacterium]
MKCATRLVWGVVLGAFVGCEPAPKSADTPPPDPQVAPAAEPAAVLPAAPAEPVEMVQEKAEVGVGAKGNELEEGLISTPVKAYFRAQEQVAFNIQIPSTMQLYKATNGQAPQSHEEFMQKIIKEGMIKLPELPEGHQYIYDPRTEQLMVEHPQ